MLSKRSRDVLTRVPFFVRRGRGQSNVEESWSPRHARIVDGFLRDDELGSIEPRSIRSVLPFERKRRNIGGLFDVLVVGKRSNFGLGNVTAKYFRRERAEREKWRIASRTTGKKNAREIIDEKPETEEK